MLVAIIVDRTDREHFHHHRRLCWKARSGGFFTHIPGSWPGISEWSIYVRLGLLRAGLLVSKSLCPRRSIRRASVLVNQGRSCKASSDPASEVTCFPLSHSVGYMRAGLPDKIQILHGRYVLISIYLSKILYFKKSFIAYLKLKFN